MKLNLRCGEDTRHNYLNIDNRQIENNLVTKGDWMFLQNLPIQDGSVEEIVLNNGLQFIPINVLSQVTQTWINKLQKNGYIFIESIDYSLLGNAMAEERISIDDINNILFHPNQPVVSLYNLTTLDTFFRKAGLSVVEKGYNGINFMIRLQKI